nr:cytochrome c [Rhizobium halophytocola]
MSRLFWKTLAVVLALVVVGALSAYLLLFRPVAEAKTNDLAEIFNHGSIGNEEAQGLPYWIWRVLPQVFPDLVPGNGDGYGNFGVYWRAGDAVPMGFSLTRLGIIDRVSPNCGFCHQGSYRLSPDQPRVFVSAGAGTRVDPQAYIRFLMTAGADPRFTSGRIMAEIATLTDMPLIERLLYRFALVPATRQALRAQGERFAWMASRPDWGPGRIDPFNPVKFQNLKLPDDGTIGNSDMMPLWNLKTLAASNTRTYSLHWDGLQTDVHETVVSGAIGDGMSFKTYPRTNDNLARMEDFARVEAPPPSPFSPGAPIDSPFHVDAYAFAEGQKIYRDNCAVCHAPDGARFRTPVPIVELGTDRHRIDMWSPAARSRYAAYEDDYAWNFTHFEKAEGYVAVGLEGLWLRAPYLHNGSVPSLRDLLKTPDARPKTFFRGSDLVDAENGGFVATNMPASPASPPVAASLYDTTLPGNANTGHLWGTDLSPQAKESLLAYLKTL